MYKALVPAESVFDIRPSCPRLPFPWGRILHSPKNWGFFFSTSSASLKRIQIPELAVESIWMPPLTDMQLLPSFEVLLAIDLFSFCLGGIIAGVHSHFFDVELYGRKVKRHLSKTNRDLKWKSIFIPDGPFDLYESSTYKVIKFVGRFFVGGSVYVGVRWLSQAVFSESFRSTWISSVAFFCFLGTKYSDWTFGETVLVSLWIGLGLTSAEEIYSNSLDLVNNKISIA